MTTAVAKTYIYAQPKIFTTPRCKEATVLHACHWMVHRYETGRSIVKRGTSVDHEWGLVLGYAVMTGNLHDPEIELALAAMNMDSTGDVE